MLLTTGTGQTGATSNWYSLSDYYGANANTPTAAPKKNLDKDSFLQMLVTQLQNQDPTDPMKNQDFIAQMAQFSSLEQMNNIATGMSKVGSSDSLMVAVGLIGKSVTALDANGNPIQGVVSGMSMTNGMASVQVGDQTIQLANLQSVAESGSVTK
jgi:flagellar basal-body rod modification protein FlgD